MNSYLWIHIWIHINYEFIWFFHIWIHMFHEFIQVYQGSRWMQWQRMCIICSHLQPWTSGSRCVALQVFPLKHVAALRASATAADSKTPCVCAYPSNQPKLCWSSSQAQAHGIAVIAKWQAGAFVQAWTWTQICTLEPLPPEERVVKVLSAPNPWIPLCVEFECFLHQQSGQCIFCI